MPLTVQQLCADPQLGLRLIAGRSGARNAIGWAHTSELLDPTAWLEGGELLMTLGLSLPADPLEQRAYIERLAAAGLAALAVDSGIVHQEIPRALIEAGDEFGLPVLAIPGPIPFLAISRAVISALTADQVARVAELSREQGRLASAALLSGSPGVLAGLHRALSATAITLDHAGELVDAAGGSADSLAFRVRRQLAVGGRGAGRGRSLSHVDDEGTFIVQRLTKAKGSALLAVGRRRPFDANQRLLITHAGTLLAILLDRPAHLHDAELRLRRLLFRSLLRPGAEVDQGLVRYAGFAPEQPVAVAAFLDTGPARVAESTIGTALQGSGLPVLVLGSAKGVAVLAPARSIAEVARVAQLALEQQLTRRPSGGIGGPSELAAVLDSHRQAHAAARYAAARPGELVDFATLGIFELLLGTQSRDTLAAIAESVLKPLDAAAHPAPGELLRTTHEFLAHGGQWEATSAALGVHRHTLRNRVDRISALLGRDLTSAEDRAEVWLALKARELLDATSSTDPAGGQPRPPMQP